MKVKILEQRNAPSGSAIALIGLIQAQGDIACCCCNCNCNCCTIGLT